MSPPRRPRQNIRGYGPAGVGPRSWWDRPQAPPADDSEGSDDMAGEGPEDRNVLVEGDGEFPPIYDEDENMLGGFFRK